MTKNEMVGDNMEVTPVSAKKKATKKKKKAPAKKKATRKKASKKKTTKKGRGKSKSAVVVTDEFIKRLQQVRGDRSQRQFALDLGVFQQNVNRYESGQVPHAAFLVTLANVEGISIDWLLLGKGKMKK